MIISPTVINNDNFESKTNQYKRENINEIPYMSN